LNAVMNQRKLFNFVIVTLLAFSFISSACKKARPFMVKSFNSQEWKAGDAQTRGEMADDLENKHDINQKSQADVLSLLGEPDKKTKGGYIHRGNQTDQETWVYRLQMPEGEHHYRIYFDNSKKSVERASVTDVDSEFYFPVVG